MTDEELFEEARELNLAFKSAVAGAQLPILDGDWRNLDYGDSPEQCGEGRYEFAMTRGTPEGWRIEGTPMEAADRIAVWLDENGWTSVKARGYSGEIADVVVEARYPAKHVGLLVIDISPGELFDSATIYATSTCEPGDYLRLFELVYADGDLSGPPVEMLPELEHPTAKPSFGFTKDGKRRFGDEGE
jgi:hypothetical protein